MMKLTVKGRGARIAITTAVVAVLALLIVGGAIAVYYYTSMPANGLTSTSSTSTATGPSGPSSGYCQTNAQGQCTTAEGVWAQYLGYIPSGYTPAAHYLNAPSNYPCPQGMDATACVQFQATCGNGVCDPNESCATCPIDCGVAGQLTCDPYTGRSGGPISVCQAPIPGA